MVSKLHTILHFNFSAVEETSNIAGLLLIPSLLSVSTLRLKGCIKKVWRPSKSEVREGFVIHVNSDAEIKQVLEDRRKKLSNFGLTLQPLVVIVGPTLSEISSYIIVINNAMYLLPNILSAIDVCFKCIWAINAKYAAECHCTWMFIQRAFYKLVTSNDRESTAANTLLADIGMLD